MHSMTIVAHLALFGHWPLWMVPLDIVRGSHVVVWVTFWLGDDVMGILHIAVGRPVWLWIPHVGILHPFTSACRNACGSSSEVSEVKYFCPLLTKTKMWSQILVKLPKIKFHVGLYRYSQVVKCEQTGRHG